MEIINTTIHSKDISLMKKKILQQFIFLVQEKAEKNMKIFAFPVLNLNDSI